MFCQKCIRRQKLYQYYSTEIGLAKTAVSSNKGFRVLILGLPGNYKKRLAENLAKTYNLSYLSIPRIISGRIRNENLGKIVKYAAQKGLVVPDAYVIKIVNHSIASLDKKSFVIIGFPSTINQVVLFWKSVKLDIVLNLTYPQNVIQNLLFEDLKPPETSIEEQKRLIDVRTAIKKYTKKTAPVLKFYENEGVLCTCYSTTEDGAWEKNDIAINRNDKNVRSRVHAKFLNFWRGLDVTRSLHYNIEIPIDIKVYFANVDKRKPGKDSNIRMGNLTVKVNKSEQEVGMGQFGLGQG
ncbi:hypothetical protein FQA39_LY05541 [Lamprigera yunnana]|nr:hypothetical protein FQA39_LY05541 [Lamprigera yunnana]